VTTHTLDEAREQIVKAGAYFGRVLEEHEATHLVVRARGVTVVVARGEPGEKLEAALADGVLGVEAKVQRPIDEQVAEIQAAHDAHTYELTEEAVLEQFGETFAPKVLTPMYHVPSSQTWQGSAGAQSGNIHLHVNEDMKLGRRTRKKGECLCSKKRGTFERAPEGETKMCGECVKVATDNGFVWRLP
jgi:hypothetical protein